jgi:hypothetical protein
MDAFALGRAIKTADRIGAATNRCAVRVSPVRRSTITGTVSPA